MLEAGIGRDERSRGIAGQLRTLKNRGEQLVNVEARSKGSKSTSRGPSIKS